MIIHFLFCITIKVFKKIEPKKYCKNKPLSTTMSLFNKVFIGAFCLLATAADYTTDELFTKLDANKDGVITREEIANAASDMKNINMIQNNCSSVEFYDLPDYDVYDKSRYDDIKEEKPPQHIIENDMRERSDSAFQKGRYAAMNDMADIAATYIIADTIMSVMVDALIGKDI